jgi:hypothetical protein
LARNTLKSKRAGCLLITKAVALRCKFRLAGGGDGASASGNKGGESNEATNVATSTTVSQPARAFPAGAVLHLMPTE